MDTIESTLASASASLSIRFGSAAPYSIGKVWIGRIGYANIPVVGVTGYQRQRDNIVPVVRQHVYRALRTAGLPYNPEVIQTRPLVGYRSRQRVIVDENHDSESCGKRKRMHEAEYTFEILDIKRFCACYGKFPSWRDYLPDAPVKWRAEVIADDSGTWASNALTFDSKQDAETYAKGLAARWLMVREWRVVRCENDAN
jgi:hypothetical protein